MREKNARFNNPPVHVKKHAQLNQSDVDMCLGRARLCAYWPGLNDANNEYVLVCLRSQNEDTLMRRYVPDLISHDRKPVSTSFPIKGRIIWHMPTLDLTHT